MSEVMERVQASVVLPEHILSVWPKIAHYIEAAIKHTHGRYETEDVLDSILDGSHLLWIAFEGPHIKGAVVSNFLYYPRKKLLGCPFVAGEDFSAWKNQMLELLQRWAKDNECDAIESTARLGWARVFKEDGYEPLWQTFELPV
jgi:hypothetical protein